MRDLKKISFSLLLSMLCLFLTAPGSSLFAQGDRIENYSFNMGGAVPSLGNNQITSVIGQAFVEPFRNDEDRVRNGILATRVLLRATVLTIIIDDTLVIGDSPEITVALDRFFPSDGDLFYRLGGAANYGQVSAVATEEGFQFQIPASAVSERGIEYYLRFENDDVVITHPEDNPVQRPAVLRIGVEQLNYPERLPERSQRMIALPYEISETSLFEMLTDDYGEYNPHRWRLFRFVNGAFVEYPQLSGPIQPGEAFWLVTSDGKPFDTAAGLSTESVTPFELTLQPGWNQVGNPYAFTIAWGDDGELPIEQPTSFNGVEYVPAVTVMEPWNGYWVFNNSTAPVSKMLLPTAVDSNFSKTGNPLHIDPDREHLLQISASIKNGSNNRLRDSYNYLGLRLDALESLDRLDFHDPPAVGEYLRLSLIEEEAQFAGNFKPVDGEGHEWELQISSSESAATVAVQLIGQGTLPEGFKRYIIDPELRYMIDDRNDVFNVEITRDRPQKLLKVIIGTEAFAASRSDGIPLVPIDYALDQNYPNPFNPETRIRYQIELLSDVKLEVYNILGQRIRTLVNRQLGAGVYEALWDARNDQGNRVASGVYFYRLTAGEFVRSKKMILLR